MLTPRRTVMAARLGFALAALGMAVLMLGPFQGLEQVFGLNDKAAHVIAFYGVASGLFLIAPNQRRDDLALYVIAAAFGASFVMLGVLLWLHGLLAGPLAPDRPIVQRVGALGLLCLSGLAAYAAAGWVTGAFGALPLRKRRG